MIFIFHLLSILILVFSTASNASAELKGLAYIDDHYVVRESLVFKDISNQVEEYRLALKSKFSNEENQLREMESSIVQQMHMLSEEAYKKKVENYRNGMSVVQRDAHNMKQKLDESYSRAMRAVQSELNAIIYEIAKEKKLQLIASKSNFVYVSSDMLDVTQEVLKELNARIPYYKIDATGIDIESMSKSSALKSNSNSTNSSDKGGAKPIK